MNNKALSKYKIKKILQCFCEDISATSSSRILTINRNTINRYYNIFRVGIFEFSNQQLSQFEGVIELDESYFGAKRVRGKRGRGAAGKTPVFRLLKRDGNVYVTVFLIVQKSL